MRRTWIIAAAVALALMASGCAENRRPAAAEWEQAWSEAVAFIPAPGELGSPPAADVCAGSLGSLRGVRGELIPTPDLALDPTVQAWLDVAQDAMFECPPSSPDLPDMAAAYVELGRLEAEVAAVLAESP